MLRKVSKVNELDLTTEELAKRRERLRAKVRFLELRRTQLKAYNDWTNERLTARDLGGIRTPGASVRPSTVPESGDGRQQ